MNVRIQKAAFLLGRALGAAVSNPLDKTIETFALKWGLKRAWARHSLKVLRHDLQKGINDQAERARRRRALTVEEDVRRHRVADLRVARDLIARNSWAVGAVNSITGNVIGKGLRLSSVFTLRGDSSKGKRGDLDQRLNEQVEDRFKEWAEESDITWNRSFMSIQRQMYRERWISNDVFLRRHFDRERTQQDVPEVGKKVPLSIEVVSGELLSDHDNGSTIKQGVEFNGLGRPIAYHFFKSESDTGLIRVPAAEVIHFYKPHRTGAVRGLSPMSPVSASFEALARYLNHELTRAGIASAFVFLHKTAGSGFSGLNTGDSSDEQDTHGNPVINVVDGGGVMLTGGPNDSLESASPAIQSTAFDPFVRLVLRGIATGLGISYELMARDFTKTNFSSARSANLEDRRQWEPEQEEFANDVLRRVWRWFVQDARIAEIPPFVTRPAFPVVWVPQGWQWIDPVKEVGATATAIEMGLDNHIDAARRLGRDFRDNVKKKALAERMAAQEGTTLGSGTSGGPPDVSEEDDDEEDNEGPQGDEGEDGEENVGGGPRAAA